jgi:starch phosphorylase
MFIIGKDPAIANKHEWLNATLFAVRDRMVERWLRSNRAQLSQEVRQVYYLSMEFDWPYAFQRLAVAGHL